MRLVKLSKEDEDAKDETKFEQYFCQKLPNTQPPGRFLMGRQISKNGLTPDETVLFSYQSRLRFVDRAASERRENTDDQKNEYPYYFLIDMKTLRPVDTSLEEVEKRLQKAGFVGSLRGQGWTRIPYSKAADQVIESIIAEFPPWLRPEQAGLIGEGGQIAYSPLDSDRRALVEWQIRERRGQATFRDALRKRYGDRCMVTGCGLLDVLEAAHIGPYRGEEDNHAENGLLLRSDVHTLFDLNLLGIEPNALRVEVHAHVCKEYGEFAGRSLICIEPNRPSYEALQKRYEMFRKRIADDQI